MSAHGTDKVFAGSIPEVYDTYLVPLIFEAYATDLARRLVARRPRREVIGQDLAKAGLVPPRIETLAAAAERHPRGVQRSHTARVRPCAMRLSQGTLRD
jgi:hypothetical protein